MGRVGAAGNNAATESFFALLQKNVLDRRTWATRQELRIAIVTWIVCQAVVIATGVIQDGGREVVGVTVGDSETEVFWAPFLCHLRERGPSGVRPVISDSHSGLAKVIRTVMLGAAWQGCRVRLARVTQTIGAIVWVEHTGHQGASGYGNGEA